MSYWACDLLEKVWFCELWLLSVWVVGKRVILGVMTIERVSYWACELLKKRVSLWVTSIERVSSYKRVILWVTPIEHAICRNTCDFVSYAYWACEFLKNVWFCELCLLNLSYWPWKLLKKNVWLLWVMPVERVSYLACVFLKNVWFSVICRLSVWVIVGVISSDTIRYCVCACVRVCCCCWKLKLLSNLVK